MERDGPQGEADMFARKRAHRAWMAGGLIACLFLVEGMAWGETAMSEEMFFGEVPVVLFVSRLTQPVTEAPTAVTVIDRATLRATGFRDLADVFRLVPGFYVGHAAGNELAVGAGLNGRYFGRLQVLVDGMSAYTPAWGQVPWTALPVALEDIERIEVTRGPNAASYGANAFLGVVNIVTRAAVQDRGLAFAARAGGEAEADATLRGTGGWGEWKFRATLAHRQDHGFETRADAQRLDFVSVRGERQIDATDSLELAFGQSLGIHGAGYFDNPLEPPHARDVRYGFQQLRWRRVGDPEDEWTAQLYHTFYRTREAVWTIPYVAQSGVSILSSNLELAMDSERWDGEIARIQPLGPAARLVWGGSLRRDSVRAPLYLGTQEARAIDLARLFANLEWRPAKRWLLNAGAMWERNDITGSELAPRLAVTHHLGEGHSVRMALSRASRTPTLLENDARYDLPLETNLGKALVPRYRGAGNLHAEAIVSGEVAYLGEFPRYGLSLDMRAFEDRLSDLIATIYRPLPITIDGLPSGTSVDVFHFVNGVDLTRRGLQAQLDWQGRTSRLRLAYAYTHVRVDATRETADGKDLRRSTPAHMFGVLFTRQLGGGRSLSIGHYGYDTMTPVGADDELPAYRRWDLRLAQGFSLGRERAEVAVGVQNLSSPYYEFFRSEQDAAKGNLFRTRFYVQFRVGFD